MQLSRRDVLRISPPTPAMSAPMATRLADLARDHPEWRLWLALLSVAQGTFGDPLWVRAVPDGPATVEPELSLTTPTIPPVVSCPATGMTSRHRTAKRKN